MVVVWRPVFWEVLTTFALVGTDAGIDEVTLGCTVDESGALEDAAFVTGEDVMTCGLAVVVDVFGGALMIEVLMIGATVVVLAELRGAGGADVALVFGVSVTGLTLDAGIDDGTTDGAFVLGVTIAALVELKSIAGAEVGGFEAALLFGASASLTLGAGMDDVAKDGAFVLDSCRGVTKVVVVEVKTAEGAEVGGFEIALVLGVSSVTGLMLDAGTNDAEEGRVLIFGLSATGLMLLDAGTNDAEESGALAFGVSATGLILLDAGTNNAEEYRVLVLGVSVTVLMLDAETAGAEEGGVPALCAESAEGVEAEGFDAPLLVGISVTVVVLVTVTWSGLLEVGDFDAALACGVLVTALMLVTMADDAATDGVALSGALLAGLLDAAGEVDTSTLVTEVLNGAGAEEEAGLLLTEILETGVKLGAVEAEGLDGTADVGEEGLTAVETATAVVVVGAAVAGVASTSPQARAAMELLR